LRHGLDILAVELNQLLDIDLGKAKIVAEFPQRIEKGLGGVMIVSLAD
jgi:hypothetical protein